MSASPRARARGLAMAFHHQGSPGDHSFRRGVFYLTDRPADVGAAVAGWDRHRSAISPVSPGRLRWAGSRTTAAVTPLAALGILAMGIVLMLGHDAGSNAHPRPRSKVRAHRPHAPQHV